uniref:Uncharacterized protein n=1 Tax=Oryza meridionalis TaxID=40149 RepID=A0A0E0D361_9ORYZ
MECMTGVEHVRQEFRGNITTKAFPALEELEFQEILKWVEWSQVGQDDFPSLRLLKIKDSHELRYLPQELSSSLTKLLHESKDAWYEEQQALDELNDASEDEQREEFGLLYEDENGEDNDEQDHEQSADEEIQYGSDDSSEEDE